MDFYTPVVADTQKLIFINTLRTLDAVLRSCQVRWLIGTYGKKESIRAFVRGYIKKYACSSLLYA